MGERHHARDLQRDKRLRNPRFPRVIARHPITVRIAIDAANLARDRRGLGRITREVVRAAENDPEVSITLLASRSSDARALATEFPTHAIAHPRAARRRDAFDVVWYPFNGIRFRARAPSVVTIADAFAFTEPHSERIARMREQAPIRRAAREATRIVTISQWSRDELVRELRLAREAIDVIALAPGEYWSPGASDPLPLGIAGTRFALVVGVREPRKNVRLALAACAQTLRAPGELLVVAGDLGPRDYAFARASRVPAGQISPSDRMLRSLYRSATVVLVPSLAEGFGLVAAEALACGTPVLASDTAALPEATRGAARLLDPHAIEAWARAIRELFDDEHVRSQTRALALAAFAPPHRAHPAARLLQLLRKTARG